MTLLAVIKMLVSRLSRVKADTHYPCVHTARMYGQCVSALRREETMMTPVCKQ